jgi:hypothetical protein
VGYEVQPIGNQECAKKELGSYENPFRLQRDAYKLGSSCPMVCYHVSEMLPTVMTTEMQIGHPTLLLGYYPQPPGLEFL